LYAQWPVKSLFISGRIKTKVVGDDTEAPEAPQLRGLSWLTPKQSLRALCGLPINHMNQGET